MRPDPVGDAATQARRVLERIDEALRLCGVKHSMPSTATLLERLAAAHAIPYRAGAPPAPKQIQTAAGLTFNFIDWGGPGAPILFLHGGALTAHTWDLVCLALCGKFRCVALDLRGHGDSAWADDYTIGSHVADVSAVVAHFGWPQVHLVGMSLGGVVAAHYAGRAGTRVATLTMVDVGPKPDFEATAPMRNFVAQPIGELALDQLVAAAIKASARDGYDKLLYRYLHMTRVAPDGRLTWRQDRRRAHDYAHILGKCDELDDLAPNLECRVLIARGGRSRILTDEKVAAFAARFRCAFWITIPDAGHNIQEDNPAALAIAVNDLISAVKAQQL
jgi:pimeloyl-ACP methyl ester carboxylesterase